MKEKATNIRRRGGKRANEEKNSVLAVHWNSFGFLVNLNSIFGDNVGKSAFLAPEKETLAVWAL